MHKQRFRHWMLAAAFALCALCGCQPTPEKPIVADKGADAFREKIQAEAAPEEKYALEASIWKETIKDGAGKLSVEIDAKISIPDAEQYPVARVRKITMSEAWLRSFLEKLNGGGKLYKFRDENFLTKEEVQERILQLRRNLAELQADPRFAADMESITQEIDAEIRAWEAYYSKAPEQFALEEIDVAFAENNAGTREFICGLDMGRPQMAQLVATQTEQGGYVSLFNYGPQDGAPIQTTLDMENMNGTKIAKEDAMAQGADFLEKLEIGDFALSLAMAGYMETAGSDETKLEDAPKCYIFYYTRSVEGVPTTFRDDRRDGFLGNPYMLKKLENSREYAPFWPQESIKLLVTDSGVISMEWTMPTEQEEVCNANVALLPFGEIQERFKSQMLIEGLWTNPNDEDVVSRKVTITRIELGMMQVREKDTYDGLLMTPTWNFYGYETYKYAGPVEDGYPLDENNEYVNDQIQGHSFLTINAVDGSVINPIIGY